VSEKQIKKRIKDANDLAGFLRRLQSDPSVGGFANDMPHHKLFPWRMTLEEIAGWLERIEPLRLDPIHAALVIVLHVKEITGRQQISGGIKTDILDILDRARDISGATTPKLSIESFERALAPSRTRPADRKKARMLLDSWKSLA
jgi:hypothetical protein